MLEMERVVGSLPPTSCQAFERTVAPTSLTSNRDVEATKVRVPGCTALGATPPYQVGLVVLPRCGRWEAELEALLKHQCHHRMTMLRELACHQHLVPHRWVTPQTCLPCPQELACHQHLVPHCWVTHLTLMQSPHLPAAQHASCARLHQIKSLSQSAPSRSGVEHRLHVRFWSPAGNHRSIHDVCVWSLPMFPCDVTKLLMPGYLLSLPLPWFTLSLVCLLPCLLAQLLLFLLACWLAVSVCLLACLLVCLLARLQIASVYLFGHATFVAVVSLHGPWRGRSG